MEAKVARFLNSFEEGVKEQILKVSLGMVRNRQYSIHFLKSSISRNSMLWQELLLKITIKTFTCQKLLFLLNFHTKYIPPGT